MILLSHRRVLVITDVSCVLYRQVTRLLFRYCILRASTELSWVRLGTSFLFMAGWCVCWSNFNNQHTWQGKTRTYFPTRSFRLVWSCTFAYTTLHQSVSFNYSRRGWRGESYNIADGHVLIRGWWRPTNNERTTLLSFPWKSILSRQ